MKRRFRNIFRTVIPVTPESPIERETRERLQFFKSLPVSEQLRLKAFFELAFSDCEPGVHEFAVEQVKAVAA